MQPSDLVSIYGEIAEVVGIDDAFRIYERFKGQQVNFPQRIYSTQYIQKYIKENYNGSNMREMAIKFNYSERRIREFLKIE